MKKYKFRLAAYTDSAGKTNPDAPRNGNEDNMFVCADLSSKGQETLFSVDKEESLSKGGCLLVVADGMGGMNAKLSPSAILLIQGGHARLINVKETGSISKIVDMVPELIEKIKSKKAVDVDDDEAKEKAFPEGKDVSVSDAFDKKESE